MDKHENTGTNSNDSSMAKISDKDRLGIPEWINEEYFTQVLILNVENFDKMLKFTIELASKKGENFTSSLYRIKVDIMLTDATTTTLSFIMKVPLPLGQSDTMSSMPNLFIKEIAMYSEILPRFEKLYAEQGITTDLAPAFYQLPSTTPDMAAASVVLEDLGAKGFTLQDRLEGVDKQCTENVLKKLAEYHAVSARYVEVYGPYEKIFDEHMFTEESRSLYENASMDYFMEYIKEYKGHEEYAELIPPLLEKFVDLCIDMGKTDPLDFNVLNHGDCWLNNILFLHDGQGHLLDSRFIDFQLCKYGSPTLDLYMILLSGTHLDVKIKYFDYFVKLYHEHLTNNLKLLKYEGWIPSLKEFHGIMFKNGFTSFAILFYCLTVSLLDPNCGKEANIDCFVDDSVESEEMRKEMFLSDRFKAHAEVMLPWMARRGFLG